MRILVCGILAAGMILGAVSAADTTTTAPKKSGSKTTTKRKSVTSKSAGSKAVTKKSTGTASHSASTSGTRSTTRRTTASSKRGGNAPVAKRTTWRNRQLSPTSDRYREIQQAMVTKGYLKPDDVSGAWDANSADALKRFQAAQNLDATGKIDSLSLIALGLGPKRDTASIAKPAPDPSAKTTGEQTPQ